MSEKPNEKPKKNSLTPMKPRLSFAVRRLELQMEKLERADVRFRQRDKAIYARIIDAITKHDEPRARVFANELVEVRKMERVILTATVAIKEIISKLRGIKTMSDITETLTIAALALREVRRSLLPIFPEAETELGEIGNVLCGMMVEAGELSAAVIDFSPCAVAAGQLLNGAETTAKEAMKALPDIPPAAAKHLRGEKVGK